METVIECKHFASNLTAPPISESLQLVSTLTQKLLSHGLINVLLVKNGATLDLMSTVTGLDPLAQRIVNTCTIRKMNGIGMRMQIGSLKTFPFILIHLLPNISSFLITTKQFYVNHLFV